MKRRKPAVLVSCTQQHVTNVADLTAKEAIAGGRKMWVATDSARRTFIANTKAEAEKMLKDYNS